MVPNSPLGLWAYVTELNHSDLAGLIFGGMLSYGLVKLLYLLLWQPYHSPLKGVPGPSKPGSYLWGDLHALFRGNPAAAHDRLFNIYGSTIHYRGILMVIT